MYDGTRGGKGMESVGGLCRIYGLRIFFWDWERVGVGKLCVWSGGVEWVGGVDGG